VAYFEVFAQQLPGGTEAIYERRQCPGQDITRHLPNTDHKPYRLKLNKIKNEITFQFTHLVSCANEQLKCMRENSEKQN
jgi:hypothetical protein